MARPMTAAETLAAMKKWGVPYREFAGWQTRGRPASTGPFSDVRGIIIHHTGSDSGQSDDYLDFLARRGRPDLPGPLCNVSTDMDGDLWLVATGRANHAGKGSGSVLAKVTAENYPGFMSELKAGDDTTDGNAHFYGNEVRYDGGQPMTAKQYASAARWAAAVCDHHRWSALSIIGHREWTRRKPDPGNCPMNKFRTDVAALLKAGPPKAKPPVTTTPKPATPKPSTGGTLSADDVAAVNAYTERRLDDYFTWMAQNLTQQLASIKASQLDHTARLQRIEDDTDDGTGRVALTAADVLASADHPAFTEITSAKDALPASTNPTTEA